MDMSGMNTLLPCRKCGSKNNLIMPVAMFSQFCIAVSYKVICEDCGYTIGGKSYTNEKKVIRAWNRNGGK